MKKAQVWYLDFLIGILVILVISVIFYQTLAQIFHKQDIFQQLKKEGTSIASSLMSEPYTPVGKTWSNDKLGRIGIVEKSKINNQALCDLANLEYKDAQYLLGTDANYAIYFLDKYNEQLSLPTSCGGEIVGSPSVTSISSLNELQGSKIQLIRFVYYDKEGDGKGKIVKMVISIWQ